MDVVERYDALTRWVLDTTGATHAMMHVHLGLAIYLIVQFLIRDRRASAFALACVAYAEAVNEILQWAHYGSWRWGDTMGDIVVTLFWPTAILMLGRHHRLRWSARADGRAKTGADGSRHPVAMISRTVPSRYSAVSTPVR